MAALSLVFDIIGRDINASRNLRGVADASDRAAKSADNLAKANERLAAAERRQADAAGEARVAEVQLNDLRKAGNASAAQMAAAEEKLAKARRGVAAAGDAAKAAQRDLNNVKAALNDVGSAAASSGDRIRGANRSLVDTDSASRIASRGLGAMTASISGAGATLSAFGGISKAAFASLGAQAASGGLLAIAGAASQAAGALALLPAAGAAAAAVGGTLFTGLRGVGDAFKAITKESATSGASAVTSANAQRAAAKQVENAQRGVVDAVRRVDDAQAAVAVAAERVADAERDVASAQRTTKRAQDDLNDARADAVRNLRDMNAELATASLDEEDALIAVDRARERLNETLAKGSEASILDRREAENAVKQSLASLAELRQRNKDLAADVTAANAAGVEGSDQVVSARERVGDALEGERAAARQLRDAQQGVGEALRRVADAQQGVTDAQRDLADATTAAATAMAAQSPAANALAEAMAKLSPNAREFVNQVRALKPELEALRIDVQDALFAGLGGTLQQLASNYLPPLREGMRGLAGDMNFAAQASAGVFNQSSSVADFITTLGNVRTAFRSVAEAVAPLTQALLDVTTVGSTFLPGLAAGFGAASQRAAEFVANARETGQLAAFIQTGIDAVGQLGSILGNVGSIIGSVFSAGAATGNGFLATIEQVTGQFAAFLNSAEGQTALQDFFTAVGAAVSALAPLLNITAGAVLGTVVPAFANLATQLAPIAEVLLTALADALEQVAPLMPLVGNAIGAVVQAFIPLIPIIADLITVLLPPLSQLFVAIAPMIGILAEAIGRALVGALVGLIPLLIEAARMLLPAFLKVIELIAPILPELVVSFLEIVRALLPLIPILVEAALRLMPSLVQVMLLLIPVIADVIKTLAPFLIQLARFLIPLIEDTGKGFVELAEFIETAWYDYIKPVFEFIEDGTHLLATIFKITVDNISREWDRLKEAVKAPIRATFEFVNRDMVDPLNKILAKFPGNLSIPLLPRLAGGGLLHGPGTGTSDSILGVDPRSGVPTAAVSNGEFVVNARQTEKNLPLLQAINAGIAGYATGGRIGDRFGVRGYDLGGLVGGIFDQARNAVSTVKNFATDMVTKGARKAAELVLNPLRDAVKSTIPNKVPLNMLSGGLDMLVGAVLGKSDDQDKAQASLGGGSFTPNGRSSPNGVGGLGPAAAAARAFVQRTFGINNIGGYANRNIAGTGQKSDHALGKAIDVMIANYRSASAIAQGNSVASHFVNNPGQFGTKYVIWKSQINQGSGWKPYGHPGGGRSDTLQHEDHVHVSFLKGGGKVVKPIAMAQGGVIQEPIRGVGQMTGRSYTFGERGPETVTPGVGVGMNLQGVQIVGTLDLGGGLEARIDGRIVSALTGMTDRGTYST